MSTVSRTKKYFSLTNGDYFERNIIGHTLTGYKCVCLGPLRNLFECCSMLRNQYNIIEFFLIKLSEKPNYLNTVFIFIKPITSKKANGWHALALWHTIYFHVIFRF